MNFLRLPPHAAATLAAALLITVGVATAASVPMLHGDGARIVDASGNPVILRGCNLGNWLLLEAWMQRWDIADQESILRILRSRFGETKTQELMETYRAGYVTPRDFELIQTFGFNVVRLPFESLLLMDETGKMRPDAFKWLDRGLEMAESAGIYVILDMHGAPGRQSTDQCTGERGQNRLWTDSACQQRMIEIWTHIAERYKDRSVVAGYDLLNEPYSDYRSDVRESLRNLMSRCYRGIRSTGDKHLVIFPNALGHGVTFYGDVRSEGLSQVAFTDHYYPGLFGSPSTVASHAAVLGRTIPRTAAFCERVGSPMLIGEFNVVLEQCGGDAMMRRYYDEFARRGWMATMWSYKILKPSGGVEPSNWYMVTNADAIMPIDVRSSSFEEIDHYMKNLATMSLAVDEKLRAALTSATPPPAPVPPLDELPRSAPSARQAGEWTLVDVAGDIPGGLTGGGDSIAIFAAGSDIFGSRDGFSFLQQPIKSTATITATLTKLANSDAYAKAGLMIRFGDPASPDYASAAFVMVHAFPDGILAFTVRDRAGAAATETKRVIGPLPRRMSLVRDQSTVTAYADDGGAGWVKLGSAEMIAGGPAQAGVAVCSHQPGLLTQASIRQLSLAAEARAPQPLSAHAKPVAPAGGNLVRNGSFETASAGLAEGWNHWGPLARKEGSAADGPWAVVCPSGNAGAWQDVRVEPGRTYTMTLLAHRDDRAPAKRQSISISLEATVENHQIALAEQAYDMDQIESAGGWSMLSIKAPAVSDTMRVLVRLNPSDTDQSEVTFDDVRLTVAND